MVSKPSSLSELSGEHSQRPQMAAFLCLAEQMVSLRLFVPFWNKLKVHMELAKYTAYL